MHQNLSYLSVINFKWSPYLWINCITAPQICQSIKAFSKEMMILIWIWETLVSNGSYQEGTKGEGFPPIPTPDTIHAFTFTLGIFLKMASHSNTYKSFTPFWNTSNNLCLAPGPGKMHANYILVRPQEGNTKKSFLSICTWREWWWGCLQQILKWSYFLSNSVGSRR